MPLFKVTDFERTKRFCVVADTVEELIKKRSVRTYIV